MQRHGNAVATSTFAPPRPSTKVYHGMGMISAFGPFLLLVAGACNSQGPAGLISLRLTPATVDLDAIGDIQTITAVGIGADRGSVTASVTWKSSDEGVATVTTSGRVTAIGNGTATITARVAGDGPTVTETARVHVLQAPAELVFAVQPGAEGFLGVLDPQPVVEVRDRNHNLLTNDNATVVTASLAAHPAGAHLSGSSAAAVAGVATFEDLAVDTDGQGFTLMVSGSGGIPAITSDPFDVVIANCAAIVVTAPHDTLTSLTERMELHARCMDSGGTDEDRVAETNMTWTSSNGDIFTVDDSGVVTAVANGSATITVSFLTIATDLSLTVQQAPASVAVSPEFAVLDQTIGSLDLTVTLSDDLGNDIQGAAFTSESTDPTVAGVAGSTVSGVAPGVADIAFVSGALSASARVAVVDPAGFALVVSTSSDAVAMAADSGAALTLGLWLVRPPGGDGDLGSLQVTLSWDPDQLAYQTSGVLEPGFVWIPNDTRAAASGMLTVATLSTAGKSGTFALAELTFMVTGPPGETSGLSLAVPAAGSGSAIDITSLIQPVPSVIRIN